MGNNGSSDSWLDYHARGDKAFGSGDFSESLRLFLQGAEAAEAECGPVSIELATCLLGVAKAHVSEWDYSRAEAAYESALAIVANPHLAAGQVLIACLKDMALMYELKEDFLQAELAYERALRYLDEQNRTHHCDLVEIWGSLAALHHEAGAPEKSIEARLKVIGLKQEYYGNEHPETARALIEFARICEDLGNLEQAEQSMRSAFAILRSSFGPQDQRSTVCMRLLMELQDRIRRRKDLAKTDIIWTG